MAMQCTPIEFVPFCPCCRNRYNHLDAQLEAAGEQYRGTHLQGAGPKLINGAVTYTYQMRNVQCWSPECKANGYTLSVRTLEEGRFEEQTKLMPIYDWKTGDVLPIDGK